MVLDPCHNIVGKLGNVEKNPYVSRLSGKVANIANIMLTRLKNWN